MVQAFQCGAADQGMLLRAGCAAILPGAMKIEEERTRRRSADLRGAGARLIRDPADLRGAGARLIRDPARPRRRFFRRERATKRPAASFKGAAKDGTILADRPIASIRPSFVSL